MHTVDRSGGHALTYGISQSWVCKILIFAIGILFYSSSGAGQGLRVRALPRESYIWYPLTIESSWFHRQSQTQHYIESCIISKEVSHQTVNGISGGKLMV